MFIVMIAFAQFPFGFAWVIKTVLLLSTFATTLPFGLQTLCTTFEKIATVMHYILETRGFTKLFHYLDAFFLFIKSKESCQLHLDGWVWNCFEQLEGPSITVQLLGLDIDATNQEICLLPLNKRLKLSSTIRGWLDWKSASIRNLQSLAGSLNFVAAAIQPVRTFLYTLYDLIHSSRTSLAFCELHLSKCVSICIGGCFYLCIELVLLLFWLINKCMNHTFVYLLMQVPQELDPFSVTNGLHVTCIVYCTHTTILWQGVLMPSSVCSSRKSLYEAKFLSWFTFPSGLTAVSFFGPTVKSYPTPIAHVKPNY